jgi:hypothetical protein
MNAALFKFRLVLIFSVFWNELRESILIELSCAIKGNRKPTKNMNIKSFIISTLHYNYSLDLIPWGIFFLCSLAYGC